ncbi:hypothetical protein WAI453_005574 [Rhynchosporium graminicola]
MLIIDPLLGGTNIGNLVLEYYNVPRPEETLLFSLTPEEVEGKEDKSEEDSSKEDSSKEDTSKEEDNIAIIS